MKSNLSLLAHKEINKFLTFQNQVKKIGGASSKRRAESAPMIGIGLTDLPNIGGASGPSGPLGSGITAVQS